MNNNTNTGFGIGSLVAVALSWSMNHSIGWAIFHALCGWFYVIYYFIVY